jgi:hypothetical protein
MEPEGSLPCSQEPLLIQGLKLLLMFSKESHRLPRVIYGYTTQALIWQIFSFRICKLRSFTPEVLSVICLYLSW